MVRAHGAPGRARLGGPAVVAGHAPLPRRRRSALPDSRVRLAPGRCGSGCLRLPPEPVPARLRGAHLRHPAAVGRAALAHRGHRAGTASWWMAVAGRGGAGRRDLWLGQRDGAGAGRHRPAPVGGLRRGGGPRSADAPRPRRGGAHRSVVRRGVDVVDRGAGGAGPLRHPDPALHRDLRSGEPRLHADGDPARPRLLVLLRAGQGGAVGGGGTHLHPAPAGARAQLRDPRAGVARGGQRALPPPRLRGDAAGGGHGRVGRRLPVRRPVVVRPGVQVVRAQPARVVDAIDAAGRAPRGPGRGRAARRRRGRRRGARASLAATAVGGPRGGDGAGCRQPVAALPRPALHSVAPPGRRRAGVLAPGRRGDGRRRSPDPHLRDPRHRLRQLPLGRHGRSDHARSHRPAVRRARADPLRLGPERRRAQRLRSPPAGWRLRARLGGAHGPPAVDRNRGAALRPAVRALPHAPPAAYGEPVRRGRARRAAELRPARAQPVDRPPADARRDRAHPTDERS